MSSSSSKSQTNPLNAGIKQPIFNDINNIDFEYGVETADNMRLLDTVHIRIQQRNGKKVITITWNWVNMRITKSRNYYLII